MFSIAVVQVIVHPRRGKFTTIRDLFTQVRDIGSGNFGVAKLMRDKNTGHLVAVKFIERGEKVRLIIITALASLVFIHFPSKHPPIHTIAHP